MRFIKKIADFEKKTRPFDERHRLAKKKVWDSLPDEYKFPGQLLGRFTTGCKSTQGVFLRCNYVCEPCYLAENSNKVRIEPDYILEEIEKQVKFLSEENFGARTHCQLIGGEVTLLGPELHAKILRLMMSYNMVPMSFTHGDFDYEYLRDLVKFGEGKIDYLSFNVHIDSTMRGRRGCRKPKSEKELKIYRQRFCDLFRRLKKETNVNYYLSFTMTVVNSNVEDIPEVIRECLDMDFNFVSFMTAAYLGNKNSWKDKFEELKKDDGQYVKSKTEEGYGRKLPWSMMMPPDPACGSGVLGIAVANKFHPFFEENSVVDKWARDSILRIFSAGFAGFAGTEGNIILGVISMFRMIFSKHAFNFFSLLPWVIFFGLRCGLINLMTKKARPFNTVIHNFQNEEHIIKAYECMRNLETSADPVIKKTQERLKVCFYKAPHPDTNEFVPNCVQHAIFDRKINERLIEIQSLNKSMVPLDAGC